jgi:hypothetical protein
MDKDCCGPRVTHRLPGVSGVSSLAPTVLRDGSAATRGAKAIKALENFMIGTWKLGMQVEDGERLDFLSSFPQLL